MTEAAPCHRSYLIDDRCANHVQSGAVAIRSAATRQTEKRRLTARTAGRYFEAGRNRCVGLDPGTVACLRILLLFGMALVFCDCLSGCASVDSLGAATPAEQQALISAAATTSPVLQPGEKIKVTVFGEDRLTGEYEIDPAGDVSLPLAGTVRAAGLSDVQLETALVKKFKSEYLRDPKVTVEVSSFRPFYILGEVEKPGEYPYKGGLNVMSAMALAGGSTYRASRSSVMIQHVGELGFKVSAPANHSRASGRSHTRPRALFLSARVEEDDLDGVPARSRVVSPFKVSTRERRQPCKIQNRKRSRP